MKNISKIFIVIVTYCGKKWYDKSIGQWSRWNSLNNNVDLNVVVVDNSPTNEDVEYIHAKWPNVYLIKTGENLGFAKANNIGIRYAIDNGADYVLLLNHDAWFTTDDGLERMIAQAEKHPEYWVVAPLQVYASSGRIERETERHLQFSCTPEHDFMSDALHGTLQDIYPSEYSCAYCWLLPRKTIETIGGFDPLFYHYGEDDNYQQRVRYHGGKVGVCPKVEVAHDIENRSEKHREKNLDWRKYLLIKWCDINLNIPIDKLLSHWKQILFFYAIRLQRKHWRELYRDYSYLNSIRKEIRVSQAANMQKGETWL